MWIADNWKDYEVLDTSAGEKLERWGKYILVRPDPQVIWNTPHDHGAWRQKNGHYHRSAKGGGEWEFFNLPNEWTISYPLPCLQADRSRVTEADHLTFHLKPFSFKHTGLFPEQAVNWDWFSRLIMGATHPGIDGASTNLASTDCSHADATPANLASTDCSHADATPASLASADCSHADATPASLASADCPHASRTIKVLNLFAYTGGATLAAAAAGAQVTHVDASKGMVSWARENAVSSGLGEAPIRWLVDDCVKFVEREIRRGNKYDGIIMDPPSYGRGPKGEIWKMEESIWPFLQLTSQLLSPDALFFLINSYTTGLQPAVLTYMMRKTLTAPLGGRVEAEEIGLPVTGTGLVLPCGASCRWTRD